MQLAASSPAALKGVRPLPKRSAAPAALRIKNAALSPRGASIVPRVAAIEMPSVEQREFARKPVRCFSPSKEPVQEARARVIWADRGRARLLQGEEEKRPCRSRAHPQQWPARAPPASSPPTDPSPVDAIDRRRLVQGRSGRGGRGLAKERGTTQVRHGAVVWFSRPPRARTRRCRPPLSLSLSPLCLVVSRSPKPRLLSPLLFPDTRTPHAHPLTPSPTHSSGNRYRSPLPALS
jgi:hypothetical protein